MATAIFMAGIAWCAGIFALAARESLREGRKQREARGQ